MVAFIEGFHCTSIGSTTWPQARNASVPKAPQIHYTCRLGVSPTYPAYLGLQECIGELGIVEEQLPGFLRVLLHEPLHLRHKLIHLLRRKTGNCLGDVLGGILWRHRCSMHRGLKKGTLDKYYCGCVH